MLSMAKVATLAAAAVLVVAAGVSTADAHKRKHSHSHSHSHTKCYPTMEGRATGQGLFGKGTAQARAAARVDWESQATNRYGYQYGNFDKSWGARWDCKKGAILKAKCVVTARPCHQ